MKYLNAAGKQIVKKPAIEIKLKNDRRSNEKREKSLTLGKYIRLVTS